MGKQKTHKASSKVFKKKKNGTLTLYNATGNITVTIIATAASKYGQIPTKEGLWNLFGDNNFRGAKNLANVFDDIGFTADFISNYEKMSGGATSYWTHFIEDLSAAGDIVKSASKGLTDKDFDNITGLIQKAFKIFFCFAVGFCVVWVCIICHLAVKQADYSV